VEQLASDQLPNLPQLTGWLLKRRCVAAFEAPIAVKSALAVLESEI